MHRNIAMFLLALIGACASTVLASAQAMSQQTENGNQGATSPVAFVYVTSSPSSGVYQINAYAAAANGALALVPGSPFASPVYDMAVNGKWLFGTDGSNIDSFSIASNGAIAQVDTFFVESEGIGELFLDHTGASLYADYYTTNNDYLAYSINNTNGQITFLDDISGGPGFGYVASFIGNNQFAYSSSCYHFTPSIYGVQRSTTGAITLLSTNPPLPTPPSGDFYCPYLAAADPTDHVAVAVQPFTGSWGVAGPYQLATYTADSSGNLTTTSTYSNMPRTLVGTVLNYNMSPSGKLLAVGGTSGLQVFHFNGANPITHFTGLLNTDSVVSVFWDNANHLYAIGQSGKLYVYTVTWAGATQAPGSPYSIASPQNLSVLPKT
jgi:hypothetical protein